MGSERNFQVKILSKQRDVAKFTTMSMPSNDISPWFFTGFADAEGSFSILIQNNIKYKTNWRVKPVFAIGLHIKYTDTALLEKIKFTMGVGRIHKHSKDSRQYRVDSIEELQVIIDHFDKYPLMTAKAPDYALFKKAFNLIKGGEHLNKKGLLEIIGIKASLNLGLNLSLREAFPDVVVVNRPEYVFKGPLHPLWIGFISGDGSFNIKISSSLSRGQVREFN